MLKYRCFVSALAAWSLVFSSIVMLPALAGEIRYLAPIADSYVDSEWPDRNSEWMDGNRATSLWVSYRVPWDESIAFLMFDLSPVPSEASITSARLRLCTTGEAGAYVSVHYCSNNEWTEEGITYNNMPPFSQTPIDSVNVTSPITWYEWNVTNTVQSTLQSDGKKLTLVLRSAEGPAQFESRNSPWFDGEHRPQLVVVYEAPPTSDSTPQIIMFIVIIAAVSGTGLSYVLLKRMKHKPKQHTPPLGREVSHKSKREHTKGQYFSDEEQGWSNEANSGVDLKVPESQS